MPQQPRPGDWRHRFWAKVDKDGAAPVYAPELGSCWIWTAAVDPDGYGIFQLASRTPVRAHRTAYKELRGPIPDGLSLDHLCRVRNCVNPDHLEPVTAAVNTLRSPIGFASVNSRKTHCMRDHEFTEANTLVSRGRRHCRTCGRERMREIRRRRREGALNAA